MRIYIIYDNTSHIINTVHRVDDSIEITDITVATGNTCLEVFDDVMLPAYYKLGDIIPLPDPPAEGMVWHFPTETWVYGLEELISSHRARIELLTEFFLNSFGFSFTLPGHTTAWVIHTTERNRHRLQAIANQVAMTTSGDAFIAFGVDIADSFATNPIVLEETVTRDTIKSVINLYGVYHEEVLRTRQYQLNETRKAEILGATDPATALSDMIDLIDGGWVVPPAP